MIINLSSDEESIDENQSTHLLIPIMKGERKIEDEMRTPVIVGGLTTKTTYEWRCLSSRAFG